MKTFGTRESDVRSREGKKKRDPTLERLGALLKLVLCILFIIYVFLFSFSTRFEKCFGILQKVSGKLK